MFAQRSGGKGEAEPGLHLKRLCGRLAVGPRLRTRPARPSSPIALPRPGGRRAAQRLRSASHRKGEGCEGGVGRGHMCHQPVPGRVQPERGAESCRFSRSSCARAEGRAEPARGRGRISATDGSSRTQAGDGSRAPGVARAGGDGTPTCCPLPPGSRTHKQLPHNPHQDGLEARGGPSCVPHDHPVEDMAVPISQMGKLRLREVR